jgi:hypothetical protein
MSAGLYAIVQGLGNVLGINHAAILHWNCAT